MFLGQKLRHLGAGARFQVLLVEPPAKLENELLLGRETDSLQKAAQVSPRSACFAPGLLLLHGFVHVPALDEVRPGVLAVVSHSLI